MHFKDLIKPDRTVTFNMQVYDETALVPLEDNQGKPVTVEIVLNKPTIADDESLSKIVQDDYSNLGYHQAAVRLLLPAEEGQEWTNDEVDSLIMQTGGYQREESLPKRALSLFGRHNPEQRQIIESVLAGRISQEEAQDQIAPNASEEEVKAEAEAEGGLGSEDPNS